MVYASLLNILDDCYPAVFAATNYVACEALSNVTVFTGNLGFFTGLRILCPLSISVVESVLTDSLRRYHEQSNAKSRSDV